LRVRDRMAVAMQRLSIRSIDGAAVFRPQVFYRMDNVAGCVSRFAIGHSITLLKRSCSAAFTSFGGAENGPGRRRRWPLIPTYNSQIPT